MLACLDRLHEAGARAGERTLAAAIDPAPMCPASSDGSASWPTTWRCWPTRPGPAAVPLADHGDALARLTIQLWDDSRPSASWPIRGLFQRLIRVAHDAARVEGRQVDVAMVGEETGLDRAVQDKAFEPLLHVVRNAVGHGIEPPAERDRLGQAAPRARSPSRPAARGTR